MISDPTIKKQQLINSSLSAGMSEVKIITNFDCTYYCFNEISLALYAAV